MAFCTNCGSNFDDNSEFCPYCGTKTHVQNRQQPQVQYQQPQIQIQQPQPQPQAQQPYVNYQPQFAYTLTPKIPGRGFGITSLVLGIISLAAMTFLLIISIVFADEGYSGDDDVIFIVLAVFYGIVAALSIIFALVAFYKGYKRGVSLTGLILGCCAMLFLIISIILFATADSKYYSYYDYYKYLY